MFAKSVSEEKVASFVQSLEQRLLFIEQKNYMLEQRMVALQAENQQRVVALQAENQQLHKALERRITDFTDVWHPMMMDNVNRIKSELVNEVEKVNNNTEQRLVENTYVENDPLNGCVLVGNSVIGTPVFCHKTTTSKDMFLLLINGVTIHLRGSEIKHRERFTLYIESLLIIEDKEFDLQWWVRGCEIVLNRKLITRSLNERKYLSNNQLFENNNILIELCKSENSIKTIYKFCRENGIRFLWNNQPHINNIAIEKIFE